MTANTQKKSVASKKAAVRKPTTPGEWKKAKADPIELPSGNCMVLRPMSMSVLVRTGRLPNSLMSIVQSAVDSGTGMAGVEDKVIPEMMGDEKKLAEYMEFMDQLVAMVALEPKVHPTPSDEAERQDHLLYVDEIDDEDKSFIFQVVTGGTTDLEQFRQAAADNVAALSGRTDVELPAE